MHMTSETVAASSVTLMASLTARIRLVATQCCVCATALADATSVELGIGPTCRKRIAKLDKETAATPDWDSVADALGDFAAVDRTDPVRIEEATGGILHVFSPFSESFKTTMWSRSLGRWNRDLKCYVVPGSRKADLHASLVESYSGMRAIGPVGEFTI